MCACVRVRLHAVMFVLFFLWLRPNTKVAVWQSRVPGLQDECLLTAHILFDCYGDAQWKNCDLIQFNKKMRRESTQFRLPELRYCACLPPPLGPSAPSEKSLPRKIAAPNPGSTGSI